MGRISALRKLILSDRPDVAVAFMHSSYIPLAFSLAFSGIPVIGSEHIVAEHYATRHLQYILLLLSSFFIARYTVISKAIRAKYGWLFRRKAVVITNPVFVPTLPDKIPDKAGRRIILSVGKLEPQKDHLTLIRAFARLAPKCPDWNLRIIGEGSMRAQLEVEAERLGLDDRVAMPGSTRNIGAEYAVADIFVLPSRYESFGLVTLEAMSAGLPVIGFADCPGTNEVITDGKNGILASAGNRIDELAKSIEILIQSESERKKLGMQAKTEVAKFSPAEIFGNWEILLSDIGKRNNG